MTKKPLTNIGIDARKLGPTGIGRYTIELVGQLAIQHPKIHWHLLVTPDYQAQSYPALDQPNVSARVVDAGYYSFAEQLKLGAVIDELNLDLVHFTNFNTPRRLKTPLVTTIHDLTLLTFPGRRMWFGKRWFYRQVLKSSLRRSKAIIVGSQDTKKDVTRFARAEGINSVARKINVVPHGVAELFWTAVSPDDQKQTLLDLGIVNPYFLVVGAQLAHKNVHQIVSAFADFIKEEKYQAYKLVIAGGRTSPAALLDRVLANHQELGDRVIFTGAVGDNELRTLYQGATALVFASKKEGFGLPLLEAFASGCPVIASDSSSMPEVGGGAAWYIDPDKKSTIVATMKEVIGQPAKTRQKVQLGRKRAKGYSWEKAAKLTYAIYDQIRR